MDDRFVGPYEEHFILWLKVWIRPAVVRQIEAGLELMDPEEREDVAGALSDALEGQEVRSVEQIPDRLRRALGVA